MSIKFRDRWIISLPLPEEVREELLTKFEPAHPIVYCERLTMFYGVARGFKLDFDQAVVIIHSYHRNINCDAFLCEVRAAGIGDSNYQPLRRNESFRRRFHITLSTIRGVSPAIAGLPASMGGLDDGSFTTALDPWPSLTIKPIRTPVRQSVPREIRG